MQQKSQSPLAAYVMPFAIFLGGLALVEGIRLFSGGSDHLLLSHPEYWVYPLQTLACGAALVFYWRRYDFGSGGGWTAALVVGFLALALWLCPQIVLGVPPRTEGFDPTVFADNPLLYWLTVSARFARLIVVVPLVEEIFWRGFLMRYLIRGDFQTVSLGTFEGKSFFGVAVLFMLGHATADWPAAFVTGLLYNGLLVRTRSLVACVLAHALTNLGLGLYIMTTRQWGFW
jgi:CAAX prenyl protease-like protein